MRQLPPPIYVTMGRRSRRYHEWCSIDMKSNKTISVSTDLNFVIERSESYASKNGIELNQRPCPIMIFKKHKTLRGLIKMTKKQKQ